MAFARYGAAVMRRMLAPCAALVVVLTAAPAWAAGFTVDIGGAPSKIFYNVPFTFTIKYKNETGGPVTNPHPIVFLNPTPNLPGGHCNPGFRATMAELTTPYTTPISEHETTPGDTNCYVWWGFDLSHAFANMPNGTTRTWTGVKIKARPPNGITALHLRVVIANPAAPDVPYGSKEITIPVATLPPPPTPTTQAPAPTAEPTEEPSASDSPTPTAVAGDATVEQPSLKPAASDGLSWIWIVAGVVLVIVGAALLVLLLRWQSRPDTDPDV
jgi:hypothetical protein